MRGHELTYLAGGRAIVVQTGVLVLTWRELSLWLPILPAVVLTLVAAALSWRYVEAPLPRRRVEVAA